MKISVIHPTRNRFRQSCETASLWMLRSTLTVEYIFSMDLDDKTSCPKPEDLADFPFITNIIELRSTNKSAIEAINNAAKIATGDLLVIISDDFSCPIIGWNKWLVKSVQNYTDFCAKTDDGLQPTLITMPIMDRIYYERYGYIYYPEYKHMFADQELTSVALMTGKYIKLDLSFPHLHYSTGKSVKDEINVKNDLTWRQGETLFNERLKTNFGVLDPVIHYSEIQWK